MAKIFLIEDDPDVCENVKDWLENCEHHIVEVVGSGDQGLEHLKFYHYELIILDWDLPRLSGLDLCNKFRASGGTTPILFLTCKRELVDKEDGFNAGADDYLTKPFQMRELAARVRALLRRPPPVAMGTELVCRHLKLDPKSATVTSHGAPLKLNAKEYALLEFFMRHQSQIVSAEALLDRVWQSSSDATHQAIFSTIKRLRQKIDVKDEPSVITTCVGMGYRMDP